jgi:hypothetical protein
VFHVNSYRVSKPLATHVAKLVAFVLYSFEGNSKSTVRPSLDVTLTEMASPDAPDFVIIVIIVIIWCLSFATFCGAV